MKINFYTSNSTIELEKRLIQFDNSETIKGILILACDNNQYTPSEIDPILQKIKKPVFGGIFPSIIFKNQKYETGFILAGFDTEIETGLINNLEEVTENESYIFSITDKFIKTKTIFIFIDGLSNHITSFIESIFTVFGLEYNYIGGGAGSLTLKQKPCIITNNGLKQNSAVLVGLNLHSGIGVKHGWQSIAGPFRITAADKTEIKEINFRPAFDVYKEEIDSHSKVKINKSNFLEIAKAFPFGINKLDAEKIVRDPIEIGKSNSLICVGGVKNGDFVDILIGKKDELIRASGEALEQARELKKQTPSKFVFFIDCISRVLFLQDEFVKELEEVNKYGSQLPLIGALTLGEIANNGKEYLDFYNKTAVIGCF